MNRFTCAIYLVDIAQQILLTACDNQDVIDLAKYNDRNRCIAITSLSYMKAIARTGAIRQPITSPFFVKDPGPAKHVRSQDSSRKMQHNLYREPKQCDLSSMLVKQSFSRSYRCRQHLYRELQYQNLQTDNCMFKSEAIPA